MILLINTEDLYFSQFFAFTKKYSSKKYPETVFYSLAHTLCKAFVLEAGKEKMEKFGYINIKNFPMIKKIACKAKIQVMRTKYLQFTVHDNTYYYNIQRNPMHFSEKRKTLSTTTDE